MKKFITLILGIVAGALSTAVLSPKSGKEVRDDMKHNGIKDALKRFLEGLKTEVPHAKEDMKEIGITLKDDIITLLDSVESKLQTALDNTKHLSDEKKEELKTKLIAYKNKLDDSINRL